MIIESRGAVAQMSPRAKREIHAEDSLVFFPTIGHFDREAGLWRLPIHGWIFRPEADSLRRAAAVDLLRRWLGLERAAVETSLFSERLWAFLVNNQPRKVVRLRLGPQRFELSGTTSNGHLFEVLSLPSAQVEAALRTQPTGRGATIPGERWLGIDVELPDGDSRRIDAWSHLLSDEGVSVISDIDDTIKITHVHDRSALLRQTFLREFEAVPGMAELYARWQQAGAAFHYVSRSPWQLYVPLAEFVAGHKFPPGTFHMRHFRWKNASTLRSDRDGSKKQRVIEEIFANLPRRKFVCVGDSGEHDPEIYAALARRYPEQVRAIYIRCVNGESPRSERLQRTFAGFPDDLWRGFLEPDELPPSLPASI